MVFLGRDFVVTVRHGGNRELASVRQELEDDPDRLAWGPAAVLHAIADQHRRRLRRRDARPRGGHRPDRGRRVQRPAVGPRRAHLQAQAGGARLPPGRRAPRRAAGDAVVRDRRRRARRPRRPATSATCTTTSCASPTGWPASTPSSTARSSANVAQVGMRQNEDMRKISAWVAILAVPTMIAGIYGMNFEHMPELDSVVGYPAVLAHDGRSSATCCTATSSAATGCRAGRGRRLPSTEAAGRRRTRGFAHARGVQRLDDRRSARGAPHVPAVGGVQAGRAGRRHVAVRRGRPRRPGVLGPPGVRAPRLDDGVGHDLRVGAAGREVVRRRSAQRRPQLPRPPRRGRPGRQGRHPVRGGAGRRAPHHVRRAAGRGAALRRTR